MQKNNLTFSTFLVSNMLASCCSAVVYITSPLRHPFLALCLNKSWALYFGLNLVVQSSGRQVILVEMNVPRMICHDSSSTGHFLLTNFLLGKVKASAPSRIVNVASISHENSPLDLNDLEAKNCNRMNAYGRSKAANVLFTVQLASMLQGG